MGQYHAVFNIDKKECLSPWSFGDGMKLTEFLSGYSPVAKSAMMLVSCSSGMGFGDMQATGSANYWFANEKEKKYTSIIKGITTIENGLPGTIIKYKNNYYTVDCDKLYGRWAGDRVVIIGDYAENFFVVDYKEADGFITKIKVPAKLYYSLLGETEQSLRKVREDKWLADKGVDNLWDYYIKNHSLRPDLDLSQFTCKDISLPMRLCCEAEFGNYTIPKNKFYDDATWSDTYVDFYEEKDKDIWNSIDRLSREVEHKPDKEFFIPVKVINNSIINDGNIKI